MVVSDLAKALGGGLEVVPPKTSSGRRRIDLDSGTVEVLKEHGERQLACRVKAGESWHELRLVFPNEVGFYLAADTFQNRLRRRGESLGVMGLTARALRHFHASLTLQHGHNPVVVSKRLGHSRVSVTLDIYAHALPTWQRAVAEEFAEALRE